MWHRFGNVELESVAPCREWGTGECGIVSGVWNWKVWRILCHCVRSVRSVGRAWHSGRGERDIHARSAGQRDIHVKRVGQRGLRRGVHPGRALARLWECRAPGRPSDHVITVAMRPLPASQSLYCAWEAANSTVWRCRNVGDSDRLPPRSTMATLSRSPAAPRLPKWLGILKKLGSCLIGVRSGCQLSGNKAIVRR